MAITPVIQLVAMAANALEDLLPVAVAAIAGTGVVNVIRGLNAKKQAQALLAADPGVKDAAATLRAGVPDEANWGAISAGVEDSLRDLSAKGQLSPEDLRRVEVGLHQPNTSGQRRFVTDLLRSAIATNL